MDSRVRRITKALKGHDSKLYAERGSNGIISVYRESYRLEPFEFNESPYYYVRSQPFHIMPLTDNWSFNGKPAEWGIEPLMKRIREIDDWGNERRVDELIDGYEKDDQSRQRDLKNKAEDFFIDNKRQFQKAFDGINTANFKK